MEKDIKTVLLECGFGFKKKFGQNFITDTNLLNSIVLCAGVEKGDTVLEIGCGAGTLTRALSERAGRVYAYEIDRSLQPVLSRTLAGLENVEVLFKDFLKEDLRAFEERTGEYRVVANLPYYITTPLVTKLLEESQKCKSITVMVQEEVAERFCAKENTPEYGAITAVIALYARAEIVKRVSKTLFYPRPQVDSAVVTMTVERGRLGNIDEKAYKSCVRAAFLSRRKTLVNNLVSCFSLTRAQAEELLKVSDIDLLARGETLSPAKFCALAENLCKLH